ncbi:MAG TPA: sigma factor [Bryobacteraceae bacterium]|nr:sigma factor [Bryobacteraceae bacterium]
MAATDTHRAIDAVWRIESARLIGGLARIVRDIGRAEDLAQDALVAALQQWPESGIPENPGAWLMATAKHRAIDAPWPNWTPPWMIRWAMICSASCSRPATPSFPPKRESG